jgi:hypothetical protein
VLHLPGFICLFAIKKKAVTLTATKGFDIKAGCVKLNHCPKLARFWRLIIEEMLPFNTSDVEKRMIQIFVQTFQVISKFFV